MTERATASRRDPARGAPRSTALSGSTNEEAGVDTLAAPRPSAFAPPGTGISWPEAALFLCLPALASTAWVGLLSAHAGRLLPSLALVAGLIDLSAAAAILFWLVGRKGFALKARDGWLDAGLLATVLAVALSLRLLWSVAPAAAWPALLDGGWYAATGQLVAREGSLSFTSDPLAALEDAAPFVATFAEQRSAGLGVPDDPTLGRYGAALSAPSADAATLTPWHPPALAAWLALWTRWQSFGQGGPASAVAALPAPGAALWPWALAWLLAIAALAALTCGRRAAPGAVLIAGLGPAFTFYGAAPYAELPAGALALGGMVALGRVAQSGATASAEAWPVAWRQALASLAGLCLGLAALFKVDLLPALLLVVSWWAWGPARRDAEARPLTFGLLLGLALPMIHFLLLGLGPMRTYLTINGWGVWQVLVARAWWLPWGVALAAAVLATGLATQKGRRRSARRGALALGRPERGLPWRRIGSVAALLLAAGWSAQAWFAPAELPASMPSLLAWLVTPLAAWGAAAGMALMLEDRQGGQREPFASAPLQSVLAPAILLALVPLVLPLVTRDLSPLYVGRRLLPVCVPVVAILAGAALGRLAAPERGLWRFVALPVAALVAFALWTSAEPWVPGRELAGSARLLERVASRVGEGDVLLLPSALGEDPAGRLGVALWAVHGVDVAVVGGLEESPTELAAAVRQWRADGRRVLWASSGPPPRWPGLRAETVGREGIISEVLAPDAQLPPRWERFEIALGIVELVEDPRRGR